MVLGYDATPHSDTALAWAVDYASNHRRPLLIVHAAGVPTVYASFAGPVENRKELRIAGRRTTDLALVQARRLAPDLDVRVHLSLGNPHDVLLDSLTGAHLLVLGTRGRGSVASLMLGSVSVGVSAHAPCPVAVVRTAERRDPRSVYADRDLTSYQVLLETSDEHERIVAESLAGFSEKYPDVTVTVHQDEGEPGRTLVQASRDADLVVVGSRGRGDAAATLFGSVSRHVVEHAHCPVFVVRRPEGLS